MSQVAQGPSRPAISVIMAIYNGEAYLRDAVDSVLAQSLRDFEFLIVNDGSTDGSPAILDTYAAADPRVRVIHQENQGLTRSLNTALSQCRGAYIARMDGDDICLPERFAQQIAYLDANPEVILLGAGVHTIDTRGEQTGTRRMETDPVKLDAMHLTGSTSLVHPSILMRAEAVRSIGGYCEDYATSQDLDLFLRMAEEGTITNLTEPLLLYRWHDSNVSVRKADQQDKDVTAIVAAAHRRRGLPVPRGVPSARWQYRRVMAIKYRNNGQRPQALRFAWQAVQMWPGSLRSWYTLIQTVRPW